MTKPLTKEERQALFNRLKIVLDKNDAELFFDTMKGIVAFYLLELAPNI